MKFVVIGGDAAGMSAASRAGRRMPDLEITVLEQSMDVSYSACGMPYNIADPDRELDDLVVRKAEVFREKQNINLLLGLRVDGIDRAGAAVTGASLKGDAFRFPYDRLLIATGASPIVPDLPGFDLPEVRALKSLEDGRKIKALLKSRNVKKVVIIGMGYIALEMCESLRARDINVDMVKPRPKFLPWMERTMADVVMKEVESEGVAMYLGHAVERIEKAAGRLRVVCSDMELEGDMVLVAIGVRPNSGLAADAGLDLGAGNAIAVDAALRTSDETILAAGDCADAVHAVTGRKTWIPLALRANRAGRAAADNVCGGDVKLEGVVGTAVFKVFDFEVARSGLTAVEAGKAGFDPGEVMIKARSRAHAHPGASNLWVQMVGDRKSGRLLGAQIVGREGAAHRVNAVAVALHAGMTVERFSESDLAYAPPFGPVWDPMLTAASQLLKKL